MVGALVVAAGQSTRMGRFKLLLPWHGQTVIGQVVATLQDAGISEIVVVAGHRAADIRGALAGTAARIVVNEQYAGGEMISSVQAGLAALSGACEATLLCLGDQPQMEEETVRAVLAAGCESNWQRIVVPSHDYRAGHPVLLPRTVWPAIMSTSLTLRHVMTAHREQTSYISLAATSILADLDTPADYQDALGPAGSTENHG